MGITGPRRAPIPFATLLLVAGLAMFSAAGPRTGAVPTTDDGSKASLLAALETQAAYLHRLGTDTVRVAGEPVSRADLIRTVEVFGDGVSRYFGTPAFETFVRDRFRVIAIPASTDTALATGYFSTELRASPARTDRFAYPIHGAPVNAGSSPGPTRAEIEDLTPADHAPVIAWADDPLEVYWLHVQGSGTLVYPDGSRRAAQYAASNGRPYTSIGKILVDEGRMRLDEATLDGIDRYLRARPAFARTLLRRNDRYIYFRLADEPVKGSGDIVLTPMRSVAVDRSVVPLGALCWVRFDHPLDGSTDAESKPHPQKFFVLAQDEGSAITGPSRIDLYCGSGGDARTLAGSLRRRTTLAVLVVK